MFAASGGPCYVFVFGTVRDDYSNAGAGSCSRDGRFGPGVSGLRGHQFIGRDGTTIDDFLDGYVLVIGIESAGGTVVNFTGPRGSRVFSPLTSIIEPAESQSAVKRAFGLESGGTFALGADRDLTSFDPLVAMASTDEETRRDGGRIAASNLRAMTAAEGVRAVLAGAPEPYQPRDNDFTRLGTWIKSDDGFLFNKTRLTRLLTQSVATGRYRDDVLSAAAHLISTYASAIPTQVADPAVAAQFTLGIRGYLRLELDALLTANTAEAAVKALAVTIPEAAIRTDIFLQRVPFPTTGYFFPSPDFIAGTNGTPINIRANTDAPDIGDNDYYLRDSPVGGMGVGGEVLSANVPAANAAHISATLVGDTIVVNALAGFRGTTYLDYRIRNSQGEEGIARIYVQFR